MTPDADPVRLATDALVRTRRGEAPSPAVALPDEAAAYAVNDALGVALGLFGSGVPRHWKSGGPSRERTLAHAPLPDEGIWPSPADARGRAWRLRGIEAEVALRLGRDVTPAEAATLDAEGAARWVAAMCVAIEIVDSRWAEGLQAPALSRMADLQSHGALVLGAWQPFVPRDWAAQALTVTIGAQPARRFTGTHALADPAWVLPALLRHATRHGGTVTAGTVVTTGSWCGVLHAAAGDTVRVVFDGLGEAEARF